MSARFDRSTAAAEPHDLLRRAAYRVDKLEAADPIVVFGARLDEDLLERGRLAIAAGPQDPHVGWTVVHDADEVLGLAGVRQPLAIRERHAIRIVAVDDEEPFDFSLRRSRETRA